MQITTQELFEYHKRSINTEHEINYSNLVSGLSSSEAHLVTTDARHQLDERVDLSNLVVDAYTLEQNLQVNQDPDSEFAKAQREHQAKFRQEIKDKGLARASDKLESIPLDY